MAMIPIVRMMLLLAILFTIPAPTLAVDLTGTVVSVKGLDVTIEVRLIEPFSPVVGDRVDLIEIADGGRVEFDIGDWRVTEVDGAMVKAEAINALGVNPPKLNMKAVIHLSPGPVHAGEAPTAKPEKMKQTGASGKVIMMRGRDITIQLDKGQPQAAVGDMVELSFTTDGVVIPVGTWRVSALKDDWIVEATPLNSEGEPNIDMDAVLSSGSRTPKVEKKFEPANKGKKTLTDKKKATNVEKKTPVKKESGPKTIKEELALFSRINVTRNFMALGKSVKCVSGKVRIHTDKIEMIAKGGEKNDFCTLEISGDSLKNFYASVRITAGAASHKNFMAGIIYGSKTGNKIKPDSIIAVISQMATKVSKGLFESYISTIAWVAANRRTGRGKSHEKITRKFLPDTPPDPTQGVFEFLKTGQKCRILWKGVEMGAWEEQVIEEGRLWLAFTPVTKGKATAVFEDIQIYRLHQK